MDLLFLYGPIASGKLTIAREVASRTGFALFHNHLIVDAVGAVFPFGSEPFVRLRERFWLETIAEAVTAARSLIFTFAPEPTVKPDFPQRVRTLVETGGGRTTFVVLSLSPEEQARRLVDPGRAAFGKLRSPELFATIAADLEASMARMPTPDLALRSDTLSPVQAASAIIDALR